MQNAGTREGCDVAAGTVVMEAPARIAVLRERCLDQKRLLSWERAPWSARAMRASEGLPWQVRMAHRTREILSSVRFDVDDAELLVGRFLPCASDFAEGEIAAAKEYLSRFTWPGGQSGHCELDYTRLYSVGIEGIRREIEERMGSADAKGRETFESFLIALQGFSLMAENAARAAERCIPTAPAWRTAELEIMAASARRVAYLPPESFRDAVQLLLFSIVGVMFGDHVGYIVPGRIDRTLLPFYERDLASGSLDPETALLLVESLYLKINEIIPDGGAVSVMVGGRNAEGDDVTNPLSTIALEAVRRTGLAYPTVGVCWHEGTPTGLVDLAIELIGKGYTTPAFFGDDTIQRGLVALGVPREEACEYINSTCVEITPCRSSNVWVASPYFSTCRTLVEEIGAQAEASEPCAAFDDFLRSYKCRLAAVIRDGARVQDELRHGRQRYGGKPLQSVFTRDCIERGLDIDDGGARYNWVECSFVGLANLTDSLHVIREEIYHERRLGFRELAALLASDFREAEGVRRRFLNEHAKYGQGDEEVDALFGHLVDFVRSECARHPIHPGGSPFVPGAFCWVMHEKLGRECSATPDGRRAGFPFADGCGPAQGREKNGPTAAILSTTSWDHSPMIGGLAYNMKFSTSVFRSPGSLGRLTDMVLTYLRRGGFETQINVVDNETLRKAVANPEAYRDLVVRIGGYSDYFVRLSREMQAELLMRTEYSSL